jgi:hypothetical protein
VSTDPDQTLTLRDGRADRRGPSAGHGPPRADFRTPAESAKSRIDPIVGRETVNGLIARKDTYLDSLGYQRQTGLELPTAIDLPAVTPTA